MMPLWNFDILAKVAYVANYSNAGNVANVANLANVEHVANALNASYADWTVNVANALDIAKNGLWGEIHFLWRVRSAVFLKSFSVSPFLLEPF